MRRGDWIQTFSGYKFWPLDPRVGDFDIADIAHALSMQCRFGGHCLRFYSVAEHSVLLSQKVSPPNRKWALLHDGPETYIADVTRPVKGSIPEYKVIERRLEVVMATQFGMPLDIPEEVKRADYLILSDEMRQNMAHPPEEWSTESVGLGVTLQFWTPEEAEYNFLEAMKNL